MLLWPLSVPTLTMASWSHASMVFPWAEWLYAILESSLCLRVFFPELSLTVASWSHLYASMVFFLSSVWLWNLGVISMPLWSLPGGSVMWVVCWLCCHGSTGSRQTGIMGSAMCVDCMAGSGLSGVSLPNVPSLLCINTPPIKTKEAPNHKHHKSSALIICNQPVLHEVTLL